MKILRNCVYLLFCCFAHLTFANEVAVTIYDDVAYGGKSMTITGDTADLGEFDKKMVSFQINTGYVIRFFIEKDFKGGYYSVTSEQDDFSIAEKIAGTISSIKILEYPESAPVIANIYTQPNYQGKKLELRGDMASLGEWNLKVGSFEVMPGEIIRFYDQENFQGGYYTRKDSDIADDATSFGGTIKSVKVITDGEDSASTNQGGSGSKPDPEQETSKTPDMEQNCKHVGWIHSRWQYNYQGKGITIGICHGIADTFTALGDSAIESYYVEKGWKFKFYDKVNYTGKTWIKDRNSSDKKDFTSYWGPGNYVRSVEVMSTDSPIIATLYQYHRYLGNRMEIREYDAGPTITRRIQNFGVIGSIKVYSDYEVTLFESKASGGAFKADSNVEMIQVKGRNFGQLKGIKIEKSAKPYLAHAAKTNDYGSTFAYTETVAPKEDSQYGPIGTAVVMYDNNNYTGTSYTVKKNTPSLGSFDNKMSSFKVGNCFKVRFYQHENYKGRYWDAPDANKNVPQNGKASFFNNGVSSVKILKSAYYFGDKCITGDPR